MAKVYDAEQKAYRVIAHFKDFEGLVDKWVKQFYELWRLQLTWSYAYSIELNESRANGVYVDLLIKTPYKKHLVECMEELGYANIQVHEVKVGMVDAFDHNELDDIEMLVLDY